MIGKPEWFTYRIFGWGLRPKTKEGWIYIITAILIVVGISILPISNLYKMIATFSIAGLLLIDTLHIMLLLPKLHDERENFHQLLIERNCSFSAIGAIVLIVIYQSLTNLDKAVPYDISLMVVLGVMVLAKIVSTVYTKKLM
jgi:hypothetical protein